MFSVKMETFDQKSHLHGNQLFYLVFCYSGKKMKSGQDITFLLIELIQKWARSYKAGNEGTVEEVF